MAASPVRRVLAGRYELTGLIATGGMGQVWRGRDALLDRPVAVKVLRSEYTGDQTFRTRFRTEAQLTGRLLHRNIAALHDYGEVVSEDGEPCAYLVMELVDGEPLSALLDREGRLPPERVLDVVGQTAAALAVAHAAGVVHRDVKPGNVLVGRDGVVKITDFGIAWSAASAPLTRTGQVVGTASYLSPEQAGGDKAGPASDVYSLGMVAWECLAGRRAFDGEHPVQVALRQLREEPDPLPADVPEPVRDLVARALVKDPAGRFPDGAALHAAVEDVRAGRSLPALPAPATTPLPLPGPGALPAVPVPAAGGSTAVPPRRRGTRVLAGIATLAAGAAIGVGALQFAGTDAGGVPTSVAEPSAAADVRWSALVGRPADEVEEELVEAGLRVARTAEETAGVAAGLVTAVGPTGRLDPGDVVTLTVAVAPVTPPSAPSTAAPPVSSTAPPTSEAPSGVPPAPQEPTPQTTWDGNGNGNGNGNAGGNGNGNGNGRGRNG
ncbi:serine/threonine-protein kinase [Geodermatophilus bullaregiensis]|uniref:protein kinase domain-containing protein n=1 Tax=Geodermatophilus bullaregiensis TaxID=1564160 RepID=UPI001958B10D|nr:protein kinase [Geodermatophilus bullaregiensis]MBM7806657.1 serine/threonine-protein kinase [Geodermatophilus bullaregiensis]